MSEKIELYPAFYWNCDSCGRENFTRGILADLPEKESLKIKLELGFEPWEEGDLMRVPDHVTCKFCEECFEVDLP